VVLPDANGVSKSTVVGGIAEEQEGDDLAAGAALASCLNLFLVAKKDRNDDYSTTACKIFQK